MGDITFDIAVAIYMVVTVVIFVVDELRVSNLKKENERLNQKLQRNNPRDAHGRFTRKK